MYVCNSTTDCELMLSARDPPSYKWFSPRSRSWPDDLGHLRPVCLLPIVAGQCPLPTDHSSFWARAIFDRGVLQGNRAPLLRLHRNYASPDARNADRQTARRATQNNAYVRGARFSPSSSSRAVFLLLRTGGNKLGALPFTFSLIILSPKNG